VQVNVTGPVAPPSLQTLTDALDNALSQKTTVNLAWTPVQNGEPTPSPSAAPSVAVALVRLRPVVEAWLSGQSSNLDNMSYDGDTLVVTATGHTRPDSGADLSEILRRQFGTTIPISLVWTMAPSASPSSTPSSSNDSSVAIARATTQAWTVDHPGTEILSVDQNSTGLTVTLVGGSEPAVGDLEAELQAALPQLTITIQWISGTVLGQVTPTPTPAPTPAPPPASPPLTSPPPSLFGSVPALSSASAT
jgi:hypothetical protein